MENLAVLLVRDQRKVFSSRKRKKGTNDEESLEKGFSAHENILSKSEKETDKKELRNTKKAKKAKNNKKKHSLKSTTSKDTQLVRGKEKVPKDEVVIENEILENKVIVKETLEETSHLVTQLNENDDKVLDNKEDIKEYSEQNTQHIPLNEYEAKILNRINDIMEKSKELEEKIGSFEGTSESQQFYYIDENLQRNIERLDRIDVENNVLLKEERRNVIKYIYSAIEKLEEKAKENEKIM